jgi:very-short-patch-repair endonuclease
MAAELTALGLPPPETNATLRRPDGRYVELDLFFRDAGVNIEIDGPHHELPAQKLRDAERDDWLQTQRIIVLRYPVKTATAEQIADDVRPLLV